MILAVIIIASTFALVFTSNLMPSLTSLIFGDGSENLGNSTDDGGDGNLTDDNGGNLTDGNSTLPSDASNYTHNGSATIVFRIISTGDSSQNYKVYINDSAWMETVNTMSRDGGGFNAFVSESLELNYTIAGGTYIPVGADVYVPIQYQWGYNDDNATNLSLVLHRSEYLWSVYDDMSGSDSYATLAVQDGGIYQVIVDHILYTSYSDYAASWSS